MKTKLDRLIDKASEQEMESFPLSNSELETIFDSADRFAQSNPKPKLRRLAMNIGISAAAAALMLTGYLAFNAPEAPNSQSNTTIAVAVPATAPAPATAPGVVADNNSTLSQPDNSQVQIHSIKIITNNSTDTNQTPYLTDEQIQNMIQTGIADATPTAHRRLSSLITNKLGLLELSDAELERIGVFKEDNGTYYRAAEGEIEKGRDNYGYLYSQLQEKGYNTNPDKIIIRKKSRLGFDKVNNEIRLETLPEQNSKSRFDYGDFSVAINNAASQGEFANEDIKRIIGEVVCDKLKGLSHTDTSFSTSIMRIPTDCSNIDTNLIKKHGFLKMTSILSTNPSDIKYCDSIISSDINIDSADIGINYGYNTSIIPSNGIDTLSGSPGSILGNVKAVMVIGNEGNFDSFGNLTVNTSQILPYTNWSMSAKTFPEPASVEISSVAYTPNESGEGFNQDRFSFTSINSGIQCSDGTEAADKILSGGSFNDCTSRLVGVRVFSGNDKVINDSSDIRYNESILWFEATPEFIDKLPDRYKSSVLAELSAMDQINKGELSQSEACSRLNDEKRFLGVCGNNSGAITSLNAYPMPAENSANCLIELKEERDITLSLYRSTGDLVRDFVSNAHYNVGRQSIPLDVTGLQKGLYFLVAESANGELAYMKFFIQ